MKKLFALGAALLLALAAASSAAANPPEVQVRSFDINFSGPSPCGFPISLDGWVEVRTTTFFDADGRPIRRTDLNKAVIAWVGPTGLVAWNQQSWISMVDLIAGTQTITGTLQRFVAPGVGVLQNDVGRLILDISGPPGPPVVLFDRGGQDSIFEPGRWDSVCAYLAG